MTEYLLGLGNDIGEKDFLDLWAESSGEHYAYEQLILQKFIEKSPYNFTIYYYYFVGEEGVEVEMGFQVENRWTSLTILLKGNKLSIMRSGDQLDEEHIKSFDESVFIAWSLNFTNLYSEHLEYKTLE